MSVRICADTEKEKQGEEGWKEDKGDQDRKTLRKGESRLIPEPSHMGSAGWADETKPGAHETRRAEGFKAALGLVPWWGLGGRGSQGENRWQSRGQGSLLTPLSTHTYTHTNKMCLCVFWRWGPFKVVFALPHSL